MKLLIVCTLVWNMTSALAYARVKRLAGGVNVERGEYPYQAGLLLYLQDAETTTWCGGALINHEWIVTAAHCTQSATSVDVFLGAAKISSANKTFTVDKNDIFVHPEWKPFNMTNDISLIKVPYTNYSDEIQPIELPLHKNYTDSKAVATGWGSTNDTDIILDHLKMAYFKVISNDDCFQKFPTAIRASNICVSSTKGSSTCGGDSGGPLVLREPKVLVGVASFTSGAGCTKGYPCVFTRVSSYLDWINPAMAKNKTETVVEISNSTCTN